MSQNIVIEDVKPINSRLLVTEFMKFPVYKQYIILKRLDVVDSSNSLMSLNDVKNAFGRIKEQGKIRLLWDAVMEKSNES